jgi:hypothetical protein
MGLVNDIVNAGIFAPPSIPRDSWWLGTVDGTPGTLTADVLLDGDVTATTMPIAVPCADTDRVLTVLLGCTRMVVANLGGISSIEDLISSMLPTIGDGWDGATWTPTVSASGTMTVSGLDIKQASWREDVGFCEFLTDFECTLGVAASTDVQFTLPAGAQAADSYGCGTAMCFSGGAWGVGMWYINAASNLRVRLVHSANWTLGAAEVRAQGRYRMA